MNDPVPAIITEGGPWTRQAPTAPGRQQPIHEPKFKKFLPGVASRVGVPDPADPPCRGIALLNLFKGGNLVQVGTGFLCQPDVLLTARHNLRTEHQYDALGIWLGMDARRNPAVQPMPVRAYAVHSTLDLAVLILGTSQPGAFALGDPPAPGLAAVAVAGYALPYADGSVRLSAANGAVTAIDAHTLAYGINTGEGDSGAPVFTSAGGAALAVAVHSGAAPEPLAANVGVRLTPQVLNDLSQMIAWARPRAGGH